MDNHNFLKPPSIPDWGVRQSSLSPEQKYPQGRDGIKLYSGAVKFSLVSTYVKQELSVVQNLLLKAGPSVDRM